MFTVLAATFSANDWLPGLFTLVPEVPGTASESNIGPGLAPTTSES